MYKRLKINEIAQMKIVLYTIFFICSLNYSFAQTGQVNIEQDEKINELLKFYKSSNSSSDYYRIQVGFGSHAKAQRIKSEVQIDFPQLSARIDFDSPTYRVRVGRFKNKLDAERKFIEVRAKYPDAMLLKPKKSSK